MWFNGNTKPRVKKRRPGDRTARDGWDSTSSRRGGGKSGPRWDTGGISKRETHRLNELLADFDGYKGPVEENYFYHHNALHTIANGGEDEPEWDTAPADTSAKNKKRQRKKKRLAGGVDCSEPESLKLSKKFNGGKLFLRSRLKREKEIAVENKRLRGLLHRVQHPRVTKSGLVNSDSRRQQKLRELTLRRKQSRLNLAKQEEASMVERECVAIRSSMKYKSTFSRRDPKCDPFLKSIKERKEEELWNRQVEQWRQSTSPKRRAAGTGRGFLIEPGDNDASHFDTSGMMISTDRGAVEEKRAAEDFESEESREALRLLRHVSDERNACRENDNENADSQCSSSNKEAEINNSCTEPDDILTDDEEEEGKLDNLELQELKREISATMCEARMSKIKDIRNFFCDIIEKYEDHSETHKKQVQELLFQISVELDIFAVGRLAMYQPEKLRMQ
jgi:hypothetical protein